ncbi:MAG TPA: hypothetical protein VK631_04275, partial [Solirubrobacteraceae bacterium]|nr:hypothetical protein [Solirubrobacteraceae bacterium]
MTELIVLDPAEVATGIAPAAPVVRAVGTVASGTGDITPGLPAGTVADDILIMYVETNNEAVALPDGWAHVDGSPVLVASGTTTRLTVLWKRAVTGETAPTITDPGDHAVARIVGVSGCVTSGNPWNVTAAGTELVSDTSASIPGATTTVNNCLILAAVATGTDVASTAHASAFTNASLTGVTELVDNWVVDGTGGGLAVASGVKVSPGAYSATTATVVTANFKALMSIALRPVIRTELDITPFIDFEGVDFGDSAIESYMAEAALGQIPVDYRLPNRVITIPLNLMERGNVSFEGIRRSIQAKAAMFQQQGGWLMREVNGTPWYADVVSATLRLGGSTLQAVSDIDADAVLTLECVPDFYGDEITLDDITETSAAEIVRVLQLSAANAVIKGDYPGRVRIVVDEDQAQSQLGLLWGLRARHYSAATTAALAYEAEALTPLDSAAIATVTGASGGASNNVIQHANLATTWTPVLSTTILSGSLDMTHSGTYRVWARCYSSSIPPSRVRLVYDVDDLTNPAENEPQT